MIELDRVINYIREAKSSGRSVINTFEISEALDLPWDKVNSFIPELKKIGVKPIAKNKSRRSQISMTHTYKDVIWAVESLNSLMGKHDPGYIDPETAKAGIKFLEKLEALNFPVPTIFSNGDDCLVLKWRDDLYISVTSDGVSILDR